MNGVRTVSMIVATLSLALGACRSDTEVRDVAVIPAPASLEVHTGSFRFNDGTAVFLTSDESGTRGMVDRFLDELRAATGLPLPFAPTDTESRPRNSLLLAIVPDAEANGEGYRLTSDSHHVEISASGDAGLFYGLQTLRQLLPPSVEASAPAEGTPWVVPSVEIVDSPRFSYRGLQLDVGRHFFPAPFIKRYIDLMARYKLNYFHWHLTEDQGWRIEIKEYPQLTEVGSVRKETILDKNFNPYVGDGIPAGGFYSQDEIREIVAYAAERYVTIVPEIEMPGHSTAALAAYPELACSTGPFEVSTVWGVKDDIYCPKEETFTFLTNVLTEVMDLFPGPFIHIGGDEVPKRRWQESPLAQGIIRREGLSDESELQSWFIRRIEKVLAEHGRRLIGWDEILEGGLPANAVVMSWRGMEGGIEAARQGHDVIMTPKNYVYLDYYQGPPESEPLAIGGFLPIDSVYAFEPVPPVLTPSEAKHILGGQANVWTEYIKTTEQVEYMAYPRALALAEVVWSEPERREFGDFMTRLRTNLGHLDALGVRYRVPDPFRSR